MFQHSTSVTSDSAIRWVENLAEQEDLISKGTRSSVDLCSTKEDLLAQGTADFLKEITLHFEYLARLFNKKVDSNLWVKVKRQTNGQDGIHLERHGIRLEIGSKKMGTVSLNCVRSGPEGQSVLSSGLIESQFSSFNQLRWLFLGSEVNSEQVVCHYLTEFLQLSRP